jgi:hypothetical protein
MQRRDEAASFRSRIYSGSSAQRIQRCVPVHRPGTWAGERARIGDAGIRHAAGGHRAAHDVEIHRNRQAGCPCEERLAARDMEHQPSSEHQGRFRPSTHDTPNTRMPSRHSRRISRRSLGENKPSCRPIPKWSRTGTVALSDVLCPSASGRPTSTHPLFARTSVEDLTSPSDVLVACAISESATNSSDWPWAFSIALTM